MGGFFETRNKEDYDRAITNIETWKANGGKKPESSDFSLAETAAKQAGSVGNRARRALDR